MKHLKSFEIFESEGSSKLTPEMKRLADEIMGEVDVVIETDREKMKDWIVETGLQKVTDEYLDSDEFREFTEASVEESEEYRNRIAAGFGGMGHRAHTRRNYRRRSGFRNKAGHAAAAEADGKTR